MATKTRKSAKRQPAKKKKSAKRVMKKKYPEEEHNDTQYEAEAIGGPERPAECDSESGSAANDKERAEEHFHKLKGKYKKHLRIEENALNDVNYHSPGGRNSRVTGTTARRKKSKF